MRTLLLAAAACGALATASTAMAQTFTFSTLDNPADPTFNQLLGINDAGVIVGYYGSGQPGHPNKGYEIAPPYTKFTTNMQPGSVQTQATGINNSSQTTGFWSDTNTGTDANFAFYRLPNGKNFTYVSAIDPLVASTPRISQALGINNNSELAGFYLDANGASHAYTYSLSTSAYASVVIGGASSAAATGVNDSGEISGFFTNSTSGKTGGFVRSANGGVITKFKRARHHVHAAARHQQRGRRRRLLQRYRRRAARPLYYTPANGAWLTVDDPSGAGGTVVNGVNNMNQLVGFYTDAAGNTHGMIVTSSHRRPQSGPEAAPLALRCFLWVGQHAQRGMRDQGQRPAIQPDQPRIPPAAQQLVDALPASPVSSPKSVCDNPMSITNPPLPARGSSAASRNSTRASRCSAESWVSSICAVVRASRVPSRRTIASSASGLARNAAIIARPSTVSSRHALSAVASAARGNAHSTANSPNTLPGPARSSTRSRPLGPGRESLIHPDSTR